MPAISHQPMVLCKGSPEKCCPAHCFFSDPFFLLNTLHYSLIFRFVKQFFKKYHVFSLKKVKIYFLTQKTRIFIIEEKAQNQKASAERWYFCMGYYDKERVRGFLHNQDGIMANDFGCFF